jgi:hydroxyacylglutathione hydrolase
MIQYRANGVTVFQSVLFETTSTVIESQNSILVVDPTWLPNEVEAIRAYVASVRGNRTLYLLFTHSDWDHVLGYKAFPDAITIGSQALADNPQKQDIVTQILTYDSRNYLKRDYDIVYPIIDVLVQEEGQQLCIGEMTLTFYSASGHTNCGIFTLIEPLGVWIAGDYLSNIEFPYVYFSSQAYESTLHKVDTILKNHSVRLLVPGHGQCATATSEIKHRTESSFAYIHTLRSRLLAGKQEEINQMLNEYEFPLGMKSFHEDNQTLFKTELGITTQ